MVGGSSNQNESTTNKLNLFKFASKRKSSTNSISKQEKSDNQQDDQDQNQNQLQKPKTNELDPIDSNKGDYHHDDNDHAVADDEDDDGDDENNIHSYHPNNSSYPQGYYSPNQRQDFEDANQYFSPFHSPRSPSESSLIFERSVEDPSQVYQQTTCPRCGNQSNPSQNGKLNCNHQSIVNLPSHYSVENFVSPCLDATTKILTDENTDLDNVDMIYSRRPSSVLGLNMALGRTKSFVGDQQQQQQYPDSTSNSIFSPSSRTNSLANIRESNNNTINNNNNNTNSTDDVPKRPPTLSFYSYADMINNENPNPKRPSISQSLSSSFINTRSNSNINSRSNSISQINNNSFIKNAGNSITPQRHNIRPITSTSTRPGSFSQQSYNNNPFNPSNPHSQSQSQSQSLNKKKFQLTPDSPNSSDSESDFPNSIRSYSHQQNPKRSSIHSGSSKKNSISTNPLNLNKISSNQSSIRSNHSINSFGSPSFGQSRRFSNLDEDVQSQLNSDNESFVVNSIGETLRKNNGEIKSSQNSIIA